jgi:hypothetical protein
MQKPCFRLLLVMLLAGAASVGHASSGTEGASFLDIPVGAGPAALAGAYTPLADNAYAATWNPAGLGMINGTEFSGQHLAYLESLHYEYLSFGTPLSRSCTDCEHRGIGGSIQYLGTGDMTGRDETGALTGDYSSYYAAYNLAYGQSLGSRLSLGATGKIIHAKIDDVSASAFAADLGSMYKLRRDLTLAATLTNLGTSLKFLDQGDPLPLAFHAAAAYQPNPRWLATSELVFPRTGLVNFHLGGEWRPLDAWALRAGFRTDTLKGLSAVAGYSLGTGLYFWGQEFSYAWLPYGDLGNTHYFSLVIKLGETERSKRNLIQYQKIKTHRTATTGAAGAASGEEYDQLMQLLNEGDKRPVVQDPKKGR